MPVLSLPETGSHNVVSVGIELWVILLPLPSMVFDYRHVSPHWAWFPTPSFAMLGIEHDLVHAGKVLSHPAKSPTFFQEERTDKFVLCVSMYVCVYHVCIWFLQRPEQCVESFESWVTECVSCHMELKASERTASLLNHWVIFPAPKGNRFIKESMESPLPLLTSVIGMATILGFIWC